ncbi:MAG: hypothetical protein AB7V53_17370, partial [Dongiaceae bacterium]
MPGFAAADFAAGFGAAGFDVAGFLVAGFDAADFNVARGDFATGRFAVADLEGADLGRGAGVAEVARGFAATRFFAAEGFPATLRFGARFADLPAADFRFGGLFFLAVLGAVFVLAALFFDAGRAFFDAEGLVLDAERAFFDVEFDAERVLFDAERLFDRRAAAIVVSGRGWGESARGSLGGRLGKRKAEERQ